MREQVRETIATRAWARWTVLAIVSFTMMAGYVVAKEMSPLQFMLEKAAQDGGMADSHLAESDDSCLDHIRYFLILSNFSARWRKNTIWFEMFRLKISGR